MTAPKIIWRCTGMSWRTSIDTTHRTYSARIAMGMDGLWIGKLESSGLRKTSAISTYQGKSLTDVQSMIDEVLLARLVRKQ